MAATRMAITVADQTYHADNLVICLRECLGDIYIMWTLHESYTKDHFAPFGARPSSFQKNHQFP